ncbi:MAG: hypothetical protein GY854_25015 [Deltaproteobacteria bacterium]|nr:hypothetical protein [Deltaproteobacteria bacterium]
MKRIVFFTSFLLHSVTPGCWNSALFEENGDTSGADSDADNDTDSDADSDTDSDKDSDTDCKLSTYRQCGSDKNVHWFDSCDQIGALAEDCVSQNLECRKTSETTAECRCKNHWEGEDCDICPENWDASKDCAVCKDGWYGENCNKTNCIKYVNASSTSSYPDGSTWSKAFNDVRKGLESAYDAIQNNINLSSCQVWVARGTYYIYETTEEDTLQLRPNVDIYGGFFGTETSLSQRDWEKNETVLDGRGSSDSDRVYHVVTGSDNTIIDGFIISHGSADGSYDGGRYIACLGGFNEHCDGGGMLNLFTSPTVRNCSFRNNAADESGGGMHNRSNSATVVNCTFIDNRANDNGGGMSNSDSTVTVTDSTFTNNYARGNGGGIDSTQSTLTIDNCMFSNNTATNGAGIHTLHGGLKTTRSSFIGNTASVAGGGMCNISDFLGVFSVENSIFVGNSSIIAGGMQNIQVDTNITNCTFTNNTSEAQQEGPIGYMESTPRVTNCILWNNTPTAVPSPAVTYSIVEGGADGTGNLDADPLFEDPTGGNLRPRQGSPCIDAADGNAAPKTDFDGNNRFDSPSKANAFECSSSSTDCIEYADIGAYEFML